MASRVLDAGSTRFLLSTEAEVFLTGIQFSNQEIEKGLQRVQRYVAEIGWEYQPPRHHLIRAMDSGFVIQMGATNPSLATADGLCVALPRDSVVGEYTRGLCLFPSNMRLTMEREGLTLSFRQYAYQTICHEGAHAFGVGYADGTVVTNEVVQLVEAVADAIAFLVAVNEGMSPAARDFPYLSKTTFGGKRVMDHPMPEAFARALLAVAKGRAPPHGGA